MLRLLASLVILLPALCCGILQAADDDKINEPTNQSGWMPKDDSGRALNLNFESGTLQDWTATGNAFAGQPFKGKIDPKRPHGANKQSLHTGEYWIGGFEKVGDQPQGTLSSVPFKVDANWCSFLVGGGNHRQTRVELVLAENNQIIATALGNAEEEMSAVVLNLEKYKGQKIFIRIVDEHSGGWGHVNFDDFRFYNDKPAFKEQPILAEQAPSSELYPYQNLSGNEAARLMQVPPGFKVQCAAHEPLVRQPIAMAVDDRGRVWIAEAYAYPRRDTEGQGRDRILIFEDTDLDGILDKRTVFIEGLNLVSGLEIGFGGVWVGAAPYLLFIPDRNHNDVPDGQEPGNPVAPPQANLAFPKDVPTGAEVVLDGWGYQDTHEMLNAFNWGPDGWLYGCHGVFTHSKVGKPGTPEADRVSINAGVWRYHPIRQKFEVFIHGTSNPWGLDWNRYGDSFCTACVIPHLYYLIPGGRYQRQAGPHFNLYTYEDIKTIARHRHYVGNQWNQSDRKSSDDVGGGHAHAGAMIYQGGAWPKEYEGKLFMHNIHGNRVNVDNLIPEGSGYAGDRNPDFLLTGDKWSQMIAFAVAPDGQVWIIDWYDQEQCHRNEEGVHDRSNGRIYRVSYGDVKPVAVDLQKLTNAELAHLAIFAENDWYVRHARRILQERAVVGDANFADLPALSEVKPNDSVAMLRKLWLMYSTGLFAKLSEVEYHQLLANEDPHVRGWCIRLLTEAVPEAGVPGWLQHQLIQMAAQDPSQVVRLAIAAAAQRVPMNDRWNILQQLVAHHEDAKDHNLPLMEWYAMEPLAEVDPQRALALGMLAGETIPLLREFMIRRLGSGRPEDALALLQAGLAKADSDEARLTFLKGMRGALAGVRDIAPPAGWNEIYKSLVESGAMSRNFDVYLYTLGLGARFGNQLASEDLRRIVTDEAGPLTERRIAFSFLVEDRDPLLGDVVAQLLKGGSMRAEAVKALARLDNPEISKSVIAAYKTFTPAEQSDARNALASRSTYAAELLKAVEDNRIPKADLSADLVRQLRNLDSKEVNQLLEKVWGQVRESSEDANTQIARLTAMIENPQGPPASRELGRNIFARTCQQCHTLFGTGAKVGPDITGANRTNLNYLLTNIVDPSAVMAQEYRPLIVALDDGRVVTGILKEETANAIVLQTTNELVTIPKDTIDARRQSEKSMMPDGMLNTLSPLEIRSLIAYLAGPNQTPILATPNVLTRFFDGVGLTGWQTTRESDAGLWTVENGELIGRSNGLDHTVDLVSDLLLSDFRFTCQLKLTGDAANAGILFRTAPTETGELRGYQVDLGPQRWGKLCEDEGRGTLTDQAFDNAVRPGDWNNCEIVAVGGRVQVLLNGQRVVDFVDAQGPRKGVVALQLAAKAVTELRLKDLKLQLLNPLPPYAEKGSSPFSWPTSTISGEGKTITWKKTVLDPLFRSEGCCVADFDNDGDLDIAAGAIWYEQSAIEGKNWRPHPLRADPPEFNRNGYSESFMNFAQDLDDDGWVDQIAVSFPGTATSWFENPGITKTEEISTWQKQLMISVTNNESPQYLDLAGNGRRVLISGVENNVMAYSNPQSFPLAPWKMNSISASGAPGTDRFSHGLGGGDLNGDGRADVMTTLGWWEQPAVKSTSAWKFHQALLGQPCAQMYAYDFSGDGRNDVLSSSAHSFGIWWHEQLPSSGDDDADWVTHQIDNSISQTHALVLADINGDGQPDFVTGRRYWAHNGRDPGEDQPAVLCWFELQKSPSGPKWIKHQVDDNSGVGTQFEVADVNGDGLLDIVISNKLGTFLFEQVRPAP
ncbi:PVC-type heme-binding CxxCH protein [Planctomicrobium piriforme]|nr:PVC-type heme-binding CxxCH protein [Planctomicrobium piriforme]